MITKMEGSTGLIANEIVIRGGMKQAGDSSNKQRFAIWPEGKSDAGLLTEPGRIRADTMNKCR